MKRPPWLLIVIAANLVVLVALAFVYPHLMVSPGALSRGHAELTTDCFACHAPWRGAAAQRCTECHAVADIGLRSTKGVAIAQQGLKTSFHQELIEQDCVACHSDHAGPKLTRRSRKPFSHDLLRVAARERCESCHATPKNEIHRDLSVGCGQCHRTQAWKPATFDHALLAQNASCTGCHKAPSDTLHRQVQGNCGQCHATTAWKPATFEHDEFFVLDRDHDATCVTCHEGHDFKRYTCYGCHEHTPANIRAEHEKEGIRNFENCVKCHRSADEDDAKRGEGGDRRRERD
ncbi:cytochrome c3 family protein [Ideonella sp.]|uniref:cytochrome c3 family protein n=1 Tax=Ideonella sp. TaxID=1929293 RepID=UPI0035AE8F11